MKIKRIELKFEEHVFQCAYIGNINLLKQIDFVFLCSLKCPGNIIIKTQELAFVWRVSNGGWGWTLF